VFSAAAPILSIASADSSRGLVARYFRAWNDGDATQLSDLLGPDWIDHRYPERRSTAEVAGAIELERRLHPDTRVFVDAVLGDEQLITVNGRVQSDGQLHNRVWIVRVADHRMCEMWTYSGD
jgi:SnoaL-like domain